MSIAWSLLGMAFRWAACLCAAAALTTRAAASRIDGGSPAKLYSGSVLLNSAEDVDAVLQALVGDGAVVVSGTSHGTLANALRHGTFAGRSARALSNIHRRPPLARAPALRHTHQHCPSVCPSVSPAPVHDTIICRGTQNGHTPQTRLCVLRVRVPGATRA